MRSKSPIFHLLKSFLWGVKKPLSKTLAFIFIALSFVLFASKTSSASTPTTTNLIQPAYTLLVSSYTFDTHSLPFDVPFKSYPSSNNQGDIDEDKVEEDLDDNFNFWALFNSFKYVLNSSLSTSAFSPITYSSKSRSSVPFFILYHSWKSFIA